MVQQAINIISAIGGLSGLIAFLWFFFSLRSKLKAERANASLAEAAAEGKVGDNWENFSTFMKDCLMNLYDETEKMNDKLDKMRQLVNTATADRINAEYHYCAKIHCKEREPELGTYKSKENDKQV
jgi:hypothetical protein